VTTIANYVEIVEADSVTSAWNGAQTYTPSASANAVVVIAAWPGYSADPVCQIDGVNMTLLGFSSDAVANSTDGQEYVQTVAIWYATVANSTAKTLNVSIAYGKTSSTPKYLAAFSLEGWSGLNGVSFANSYSTPYLGTLPDAAVANSTLTFASCLTGDVSLCINNIPSTTPASTGATTLGSFNLSFGAHAGIIRAVVLGSNASISWASTFSSFQRSRNFSAIVLHETARDSLTIDPVQFAKVFKVDQGQTYRTHTFSGRYYGSVTSVQVRILKKSDSSVVVDWTNVDTSLSGNVWSGTLQVPIGGPYIIQARAGNNTSLTTQLDSAFFVGVSLLMYGQSNSIAFNTAAATGKNSLQAYRIGCNSAGIIGGGGPWGVTANVGGAIGFWEVLYQQYGIPFIFHAYGTAGTPLELLDKPSSSYTTLQTAISQVGCDSWLFIHGEGDIAVGTSKATYKTLLAQLHADIKSDADNLAIPCIVGSPNRSYASYTAANVLAIRAAQLEFTDEVSDAFYSHSILDLQLTDSLHISPTGRYYAARRYAHTASKVLGLGSTKDCTLFIGGAYRQNDTTVDVEVVHNRGTDITPSSGIAGFQLSFSGGGAWSSPSSAVRLNANTIRLTYSSNAIYPLVRYCSGEDPPAATNTAVTTLVRDNSDETVPLMFTNANIQSVDPPASSLSGRNLLIGVG
jgi:hypothetical protein